MNSPRLLRKCFQEARDAGQYTGGLFAGDFLHTCFEDNEAKINDILQELVNSVQIFKRMM